MSNVTKILILALAIIGIGTSAAVCAHYFSVNDGDPIHKNSRKDPQGVYEIYNDNVISGEQVKLALSLYKGFDYTSDNDNLDSGMCWIQTGEVREQYKDGGRSFNHLVGSDYADINDTKKAAYINPTGSFRATLVFGDEFYTNVDYGSLDPDKAINFSDELMCLRFEQITLKKRDPDPVDPSREPTEPLPDPEIELITPIPPDPAPEGEVYRVWRSDYSDLVKEHSEWIECPKDIPQVDKTVYEVNTYRTDKGKSIPVTIYVYDVGGDSEGEVAGHQQCLEFVNWDEFVTIESTKCTIDNNESSVYKLRDTKANTTIFSDGTLMGQYDDGMASAYKPTNDQSCGKTTVWFVNDKNKSQKITFSVTAKLVGGLNTAKLTKTFNYTIDWTPWTAKAANLTAMYTYTQTPDSVKDYYSTGAGWEKVVAELGLKDPAGQINNITTWKDTFSDKGLKELHDSVGYDFGVIEGCSNPDAAITSKVAGGDLVLVRAYGTAFEASGLADNQLFDIVKESKTEGEEDPKKDGTEDNRSGILVRVLKAKNLDKAKVWDGYARDKHNGFIEKLQENFRVVYQPFQYNLQSWNLLTNKAITGTDTYDFVTVGVHNLEFKQDKAISAYYGKQVDYGNKSIEDLYVDIHPMEDVPFDEIPNGECPKYVLQADAFSRDRGDSNSYQGMTPISLTYNNFGERYSETREAYAWYPLNLLATYPTRGKDYSLISSSYKAITGGQDGEAVVVTSNQSVGTTITLDAGANSINEYAGAITKNQKSYRNGKTNDKIAITALVSALSEAYTAKPGTSSITATATRARTGEKVTAVSNHKEPYPDLYSYYEESNGSYSTPKKSDLGQPATTSHVDSNRIAIGDVFIAGQSYDGDSLRNYDFSIYQGGSNSSQTTSTAGLTKIAAWDSYNSKFTKESTKAVFCDKSGKKSSSGNAFMITEDAGKNNYVFAFDVSVIKYHFPEQDRSSSIISVIKEIVERIISVVTKSHDYGGLEAERCYTIYDFRDGYVDTLKGANKDADGKYYAYTGDEIKIASHYVATYGNGDNVTFRHNGTEGRWTVKHSTDVAMLSTEADACDPSHKDNTMTATGGTYAGADAKLTIAHQEFDGRTKQKSLTVYKKFEKTVHVTELHEMSIDLANAKDDEGQAIAELTDCELKMHDIGDCAYKDSNGNKITAEKKPLKWYSSDSVEDDAKGTGTYKSNKYVHSAVTTKAGKITIVTKAYKDGNPCVIGVIQDNLEIGTITVYTLPFKAATLVGMRDNIGYGKDTLNKKIYLEIENFYAGDDLYVFTNVKGSNIKVEAEGEAAQNLEIENKDTTADANKECIFKVEDDNDGNFETTLQLADDESFERKKCTLNTKGLSSDKYWEFFEQLCNTELKVTATDEKIAQVYKDAGITGNTQTFAIAPKATQTFSIPNNVWQYNPTEEQRFWGDRSNPLLPGTIYGWKRTDGWYGGSSTKFQDLQYYNVLAGGWDWAIGGLDANKHYATNDNEIPLQSFIRLYTRDSNSDSDGIGVNACVKAKHEFAGSIGGEYIYKSDNTVVDALRNGGLTHHYAYSMEGADNNPFIFSNVAKPESGWSNTYTSMYVLNSGLMSMQANKYGSNGAKSKTDTATSIYMSMSPFVNSETEDRYKFLDNLSWSGTGIQEDIVTNKGVVSGGEYFTDKRYCVMLNAGKPEGSNIYINNQALAQFTTTNDKPGNQYIYFHTPAHSIIVTYKIDDGKWKIIKKGTSDPKEQISDLYDKDVADKTILQAAAKYDEKGKITGGVNFDANKSLFGYKNYLSFREGTKKVGVGMTNDISFSGTNYKDSVLGYAKLDKFLGMSVANGNSWGVHGDAVSNIDITRIDATALGWTECTNYVDVNFTYVTNPEAGSRQVTFPVRLIKGKQ